MPHLYVRRNIRLILGFIVPQNAKVPILASKLPCLKHLDIELLGPTMAFPPFRNITDFPKSYDVFSLVSFLDASPTLDSFILRVSHYPRLLELSVPITMLNLFTETMTLMLILHV